MTDPNLIKLAVVGAFAAVLVLAVLVVWHYANPPLNRRIRELCAGVLMASDSECVILRVDETQRVLHVAYFGGRLHGLYRLGLPTTHTAWWMSARPEQLVERLLDAGPIGPPVDPRK